MSEAVCRECGKAYERKDEQNNGFCSARCRKNYRRKHPDEKGYQKICAFCGTPFGTNSQSEIYCSDDCRKKAEPWKYPYERVCEYCGKTFMAKKPDARFCSCKCAACFHADETRKPDSEKKPKKDTETEKICRNCGKPFHEKKRGRESNGFCCKSCADSYRVKHKAPKYQKICEHCGKEYGTNYSEQRYCSHECAGAEHNPEYKPIHCAICGAGVVPTSPSMKYCPACSAQLTRERKHKAYTLRRQQTGDSHNTQVKLSEVYERAGGICEICGLPVPEDIDYNDEWARTRDHIVPVSKDGEHSYSNCQLAHRICNSCKQDHGIGWSIDWLERLEEEPGKWEDKLDRLDGLLEEEEQKESA